MFERLNKVLAISMKILTLLICTGLASLYANSSIAQTRIDLSIKNGTYTQLFKEIETKSEFSIFYKDGIIDNSRTLNLSVSKSTIPEILDKIFKDTDLIYSISNSQIVIDRKAVINVTDSTPSKRNLQQAQISGTVTDSKQVPLPGVNIVEKGTTNGVVSDFDGNYSITVSSENAVLVFSFIGFRTKEIPVGQSSTIDVNLEEDAQGLDEVVVIGYGTTKRSDLTGSVVSVSGDDAAAVPVASVDQSLQGRAAGVNVTQNSAAPGGSVSIRIRGGTSINAASEPLYVIDGFPIFNDNNAFGAPTAGALGAGRGTPPNILSTLNPSDIASIDILKDASATAIYGARGANGVVIITTKRGQSGKLNIDYDTYYGIQEVSKTLDLMNATEYARFVNEAIPDTFTEEEINSFGQGTNWQDEIFRSASIKNHNLSISGGNEKTNFAISGSYFDQEGLVLNSDFERFSWRTNVDSRINNWLKAGTSISITHSINNGVAIGVGPGANAGPVNAALEFSPTVPVFDEDGEYSTAILGGTTDNPVAKALEISDETKITRLLGNSYFDIDLTKGLQWRTTFGADLFYNTRNFFSTRVVLPGSASNGFGSIGNTRSITWNISNTLTYSIDSGDNNLTFLLGNDIQQNKTEQTLLAASNFVSDDLGVGGIDLASSLPSNANFIEWSILSYFARADYIWKNKLFLTATGRVDGSSRFAENNKYAFFPSGALAYRVSEEPFLQDSETINNLKLRVGYGITGNQEIGVFQSLALFGIDDVDNGYTFGSGQGNPIIPLGLANPDLKWESTEQYNVGIDLGLWNNRIGLTADYYHKNTEDLLLFFPVPPNSGASSQLRNAGAVQNKGFELALNTINLNGDFKWTTDFNISFNTNEVTDLAGLEEILIEGSDTGIVQNEAAFRIAEGDPLGSIFGYQFDGVYQTQEDLDNSPQYNGAEVGLFKYKDISGPDGVPDGVVNGDDRTVIGNAQPDFFGGFNNSFSYKGLTLDVFLNFTYGNDILNVNRSSQENSDVLVNQLATVNDYWRGEGTSTTIQRPVEGRSFNIVSDRFIEDGSFIRARLIRLSYDFPLEKMNVPFLRSLNVYGSVENAFIITDYSGFDPEVNTLAGGNAVIGVDNAAYPRPRTFLLGIKVGL